MGKISISVDFENLLQVWSRSNDIFMKEIAHLKTIKKNEENLLKNGKKCRYDFIIFIAFTWRIALKCEYIIYK